ncbi:MAG: AAA family ATPase [Nanoarchaeota archaeon]
MIIKSIELNNIRSYTKAHLRFPEGSVSLSGDIGAGKSSILVAIEFALFGIKRGEISGGALLRHGAKEGYVILALEVSGKDVVIKRVLKRTKQGVKQESGYLVVEGVKTELTPEEIKARVLDLLGYPKDLLKKGKDLVYRFTVYTPQEQMKAIVFEGKEDRLNTLRKVFGIDKYKKIRENAVLYNSELKGRKRTLEGKTYGLEEKIKKRDERAKEIQKIKQIIKELEPKLNEKKREVSDYKKGMQEDEKTISNLNELRNRVKIIDTQLMNKYLMRRQTKEKMEQLNKQIEEMEKNGLSEVTEKNYSKFIKEKREWLKEKEGQYHKLNKSIGEIESSIKSSKQVIDKINSMRQCPTCEQDVTSSHKEKIFERENKKIEGFWKEKAELEQKLNDKNREIAGLNEEIEKLLNNEKNAAIERERIKSYYEKKEQLREYEKHLEQLKKEIGELNSEKIEKNKSIEAFGDIEKRYESAKITLENMQKEERELERQATEQKAYLSENEKTLKLYDDEISEKKKFKKDIQRINKIQNWLEEHFLNLMTVIEKKVMGRLYNEFNELFVEWFRILIEDETLNVRLDEQFSPVIEQNGFETDISYLSGGEKTSVALAYRLALNKVINDFITHLNTRHVIILDEPTDGFSDEQLDNVRDVLGQLNVRQVIIVSHEAKIESFVDNIIRVEKEHNKSTIIT